MDTIELNTTEIPGDADLIAFVTPMESRSRTLQLRIAEDALVDLIILMRALTANYMLNLCELRLFDAEGLLFAAKCCSDCRRLLRVYGLNLL